MLNQFRRGLVGGDRLGDAKAFEFRFRLTEFAEADTPRFVFGVGDLNHQFVVEITEQPFGLDAHLQRVPAGLIELRRSQFFQHLPGVNVRSIEATQSNAAVAGIEPVVPVASIGMKDQSGGSVGWLELHLHGDLIRNGGRGLSCQAQRTSAQSGPLPAHKQMARPLSPTASPRDRPFLRVESTDRQPAVHRDRIRLRE